MSFKNTKLNLKIFTRPKTTAFTPIKRFIVAKNLFPFSFVFKKVVKSMGEDDVLGKQAQKDSMIIMNCHLRKTFFGNGEGKGQSVGISPGESIFPVPQGGTI